jgi:ABC-2 type transport system permease protein
MSAAVGMAWRQYRLERRMFWRNPTAAFFNFLFPLILLGLFGAVFANDQKNLNVIVPGIAGMAIMATTFTALAFNMTFLREQGVLKRIRGTPLPASAYLAGVFGSAVANAVLQIVIIVLAGKAFFGIPWPPDPFELAVFAALGVVCFASLGIALSHAIPNFESAPAYTNAIFLPVIFISGVFFDADKAPKFLTDIAEALPLIHLINGLSSAMVTGKGISSNWTALAVLAVWSAIGIFFAIRGFSWEARRS